MSLPRVELDNINQPDDRRLKPARPPLIGIAFFGIEPVGRSDQPNAASASCASRKARAGRSPMSNFGRAARQSTSVRSALGWRPAPIALAGPSARFPSFGIAKFAAIVFINAPMPTEMPTNWTDGANFLPVFSTGLEKFSQKIWNRNKWF